jgi:hypothetical protein
MCLIFQEEKCGKDSLGRRFAMTSTEQYPYIAALFGKSSIQPVVSR